MTLKEQLKNQKEQNAKIVGENFELNKELKRLRFENEKLDTEISSQIIELEAAEHQIKNQKEQNAKIVGENFELNKLLGKEYVENKKLKGTISSQEFALKSAENQLNNYIEANNTLKGQIAAYENVIRILSGKENNTHI